MDIGPGDYVECLDASSCKLCAKSGLKLGGVYCVSEVCGENESSNGRPWVDLIGSPHPSDKCRWAMGRFRPIYRPKADAFTHLLTDIPSDLEAA